MLSSAHRYSFLFLLVSLQGTSCFNIGFIISILFFIFWYDKVNRSGNGKGNHCYHSSQKEGTYQAKPLCRKPQCCSEIKEGASARDLTRVSVGRKGSFRSESFNNLCVLSYVGDIFSYEMCGQECIRSDTYWLVCVWKKLFILVYIMCLAYVNQWVQHHRCTVYAHPHEYTCYLWSNNSNIPRT